MPRFANCAAALAAAAALTATAASATTTKLNYEGQDLGKDNMKWSAASTWAGESASGGASAGAFTMTYDGTADSFIAWCIDLFDYIRGGSPKVTNPISYTASPSPLPTGPGEALERLQGLFDRNYDDGFEMLPKNDVRSAAFQAAIWNTIYDTDQDVTTGSGTDFFKITDANPDAKLQSVIALANDYLDPSKGDYLGQGKRWDLTLWNGSGNINNSNIPVGAQDLVSVHSMPVPAGVLLVLSAFGAAGIVRRRARAA